MDDLRQFFLENAKKLDIDLTNEEIENFFIYKDLLIEKNKVMNLTAIVEEREIILKHFIDSITVLKFLPKKKENISIIDIGTGAGLPGIPIKIMRKEVKITLFDSLNKRLLFLKEVSGTLKFKDVNFVHGRAEDFGNNINFRDKFHVAISRAVANLPVLLELCLPFVKVGGVFIAMKGAGFEDEIEKSKLALEILGGKIIKVEEFLLTGTDNKRAIIIVEKIAKTPKNYPRRAGVPNKEPLI